MSTDTITVKAISERGRWRAGRHFTRAGVSVNVASLSKEELDAIRNDPQLRVTGAPESAAEQAAAEPVAAEQTAAGKAAAKGRGKKASKKAGK